MLQGAAGLMILFPHQPFQVSFAQQIELDPDLNFLLTAGTLLLHLTDLPKMLFLGDGIL